MNPLNLICHRRKDRSFSYKGYYFPVCARCTGLHISFLVCFCLMMVFQFHYTTNIILISFLLLVPTGVDGFTQLFKLRESNNYLRLVTGLLSGVGIAILMKVSVLNLF